MGAIKIPIPIFSNGKTFSEVVVKPLKTEVIADTNQVMEKGDIYRALQVFIAGSIESIGDITDKIAIRALVGLMPYQSANFIATKIIFADEKDDGVEGYYQCPRCGMPKLAEANDDPDLDTRDHLSDLKVRYCDEELSFSIDLNEPVELVDADSNIDGILSVTLNHPTLNDCSMAFSKIGDKDKVRLQLQVYVQALTKVNNVEVDKRFKNNFGMFAFEKMDRKDLRKISDKIQSFGLDTEVKKVCSKCQKEWTVNVNTSNFFVSALQ